MFGPSVVHTDHLTVMTNSPDDTTAALREAVADTYQIDIAGTINPMETWEASDADKKRYTSIIPDITENVLDGEVPDIWGNLAHIRNQLREGKTLVPAAEFTHAHIADSSWDTIKYTALKCAPFVIPGLVLIVIGAMVNNPLLILIAMSLFLAAVIYLNWGDRAKKKGRITALRKSRLYMTSGWDEARQEDAIESMQNGASVPLSSAVSRDGCVVVKVGTHETMDISYIVYKLV